jgi:hypothetical protein
VTRLICISFVSVNASHSISQNKQELTLYLSGLDGLDDMGNMDRGVGSDHRDCCQPLALLSGFYGSVQWQFIVSFSSFLKKKKSFGHANDGVVIERPYDQMPKYWRWMYWGKSSINNHASF